MFNATMKHRLFLIAVCVVISLNFCSAQVTYTNEASFSSALQAGYYFDSLSSAGTTPGGTPSYSMTGDGITGVFSALGGTFTNDNNGVIIGWDGCGIQPGNTFWGVYGYQVTFSSGLVPSAFGIRIGSVTDGNDNGLPATFTIQINGATYTSISTNGLTFWGIIGPTAISSIRFEGCSNNNDSPFDAAQNLYFGNPVDVCGGCNLTNANSHCDGTSKLCVIDSCLNAFQNCDGIVSNGCENPVNNVTYCGSCSNNCVTLSHVSSSQCDISTCEILTCSAGYQDCNLTPLDGCEVSNATLQTSPQMCGSCNNNCTTLPNVANTSCNAGVCEITDCQLNFGDVDGIVLNGCEDTINNDTFNCGSVGNNCSSLTNVASTHCFNSECVIDDCEPGFTDCDGLVTNGCEINSANDILNCGGCGNNCTNAPFIQTTSCSLSACHVTTCLPNYYDYDGNGNNGCESPCVSSNCFIDKSRRKNGPVTISLSNMQVANTLFVVSNVSQNNANVGGAQQLKVVDGKIQLTISPNLSGAFTFKYAMTYYFGQGDSFTEFNNQADFNIVNHQPTLGNTAYTYSLPRSTPFNFNLLTDAYDIDGDSISITQVLPKKSASPALIQQVDSFTLLFIDKNVLAQVGSNGTVTLSHPIKNGSSYTAGSPLESIFSGFVAFEYEVTDGDRDNQFSWGVFSLQPAS